MRLEIGDKIYSKRGEDKLLSDCITSDKAYEVTHTRPKSRFNGDDICILGDDGIAWWFGQIGETECWTNFFISEKEWLREKKLNQLGIY
jgi:hypothetical protein